MSFAFHGQLEWKNGNIRFEYTPEEWAELDKCLDDPEYFIESYCNFMTDYGRVKVKLRKYQRELIHLMGDEHYDAQYDLMVPDNRNVLIMQSRQTGKTSTTVAFAAHYILSHHDRNIMIGANARDTAEEIFSKFQDVLKGLPWFLKPGVVSMSKKMMVFDNGCKIVCIPTTGASGVGFTIHVLILDEFGVIPAAKARSYYTSVKPTLSSSKISQLIIMSTPRSKAHIFYELYIGSLQKKNTFVTKTVYYYEVDAEHASEEWKQKQIAEFGARAFAQEFDLQFDAGGGGRIVSAADMCFLNRISRKFVSVPVYGVPNNVSEKILWKPGFRPDLLTEDDLISRRFLLQVDTAGGKIIKVNDDEDQDWNVINIYEIKFMSPARIKKNRLGYKEVKLTDCIRFEQVGIYMDHDFNEEFSAEAAKHIVFTIFKNGLGSWAGQIDNVRILIEVNFNGANWIKKFIKHDMFYPQLFIKTKHSQNAVKSEIGFKTVSGQRGKGYWCEAGVRLIERRQIIVYQESSDAQMSTVNQLGAFQKDKRGSYGGGDGMHDDIAVTVLFVSIAPEQEDFQFWIEDWYRLITEYDIVDWELKRRLRQVAVLMEQYVEQTFDDEYSEQDIKNLFGNAASGFGKITSQQGAQSYGNMIAGRQQSPLSGTGNGFPGIPGGNMSGYGAYSRGTRYNNPRPYTGPPRRN